MVKRVLPASYAAEFARLKADIERLNADLAAVRQQVQEQRAELRIQFTRIAEMHAILDEERIANNRPREPRPLMPAANLGTLASKDRA